MNRRPNVLFIVADQLRYQALSGSGDTNVRTPNIDRLASEGVACRATYSNYPVCMPFRAALFTGQYPTTCGVSRHGDFLPPNVRTMAHSFSDAGYRTSYVGKWHLAGEHGINMVSDAGWAGEDYWVHPAMRGGFSDWFGFNVSNNYYRTFYSSGEKVEPHRLEGYQTDALTDLSLDYLKEAGEGPWFHVVAYESPHPGRGGEPKYRGYPVPSEYEERFDPASIRLRPNVPDHDEERARNQLCGYYALIENLDTNVGTILDWLDTSGRARDTIVVFLADHGEMAGSHGLRDKQVAYDESIHVPLVFRVPSGDGYIAGGSSYDGLMSGVDVFPTCAGLCNIPLDSAVQGIDQHLSVCGAIAHRPRSSVLVQWLGTRFSFGDHPYRAIRTERYTYAAARDPEYRLLFDNELDPYQLENRFGDPASADQRASLHAELRAAVLQAGESLPEWLDDGV